MTLSIIYVGIGLGFFLWSVFGSESYITVLRRALIIIKTTNLKRKREQALKIKMKEEKRPLTFKQSVFLPKEFKEEVLTQTHADQTSYREQLDTKIVKGNMKIPSTGQILSSMIVVTLGWGFIAFMLFLAELILLFYLDPEDFQNQ